MSVAIRIDEATPLLEQLRSESQARDLALVGARAVAGLVRDHLYGLDGQRHRYGTHFFRQAGDSVHSSAVPQGAVVSITQLGFRLRLLGGTVVPGKNLSSVSGRPTRYLTIPANPEAAGMRASEFNDLEFKLVDRDGSIVPALVRRVQHRIRLRRVRTQGGTAIKASDLGQIGGEVMFWLVKKTVHQADPTVLPYAEQMSTRAVDAMKRRIERLTDRVRQGIRGDNGDEN